jgi:hypothetical protein
MYLPDVIHQLALFKLPGSNWMLTPIIVPTTAHLEYLTHLLNRKLIGVLGYKPEYFPSPLEKMLTAFFCTTRY